MAGFGTCFILNQTARLPVFAGSRAVVCHKDTKKLAEPEAEEITKQCDKHPYYAFDSYAIDRKKLFSQKTIVGEC